MITENLVSLFMYLAVLWLLLLSILPDYRKSAILPVSLLTFFFTPQIAIPK